MLDFAIFAKGRADETDRITAVALNFEVKGKRFAFNGYRISILAIKNQAQNTKCMATNEMQNGCGSSVEAVRTSNQKRRRVYGPDKVARALEDAFEFRAFSSDYIANILEQRERLPVQPGPLHLTRRSDLLEVELAPVDISIYDPADPASTPDNA